jgi:hypothetical protein
VVKRMYKRVVAVALGLLGVFLFLLCFSSAQTGVYSPRIQPNDSQVRLEEAISLAVQQTLKDNGLKIRSVQSIELIGLDVVGNNISLNFSREFLNLGFGMELEYFFDLIYASITRTINKYLQMNHVKYSLLIEGDPIEQFYPNRHIRRTPQVPTEGTPEI